MIDQATALRAYQATLRDLGAESPGQPAAQESSGPSFAEMVGDGLKAAVDSGREAEELSLKGIAGQADMTEVITAVNNAEIMLQTVVAVRDRVLQAYQEVMRMPI
jgi:flagellar hook-basal body complex protein FliE